MRFSTMCLARAVVLTAVLGSSSQGGTILHTVSDSQYTSTGAGLTNVGALRVDASGGTFGCSATLIDDGSWLLTAGHCTDGATPQNTTFSLGASVGTSGGAFFVGSQTFGVAEVIPHPKWDGSLGRGYDLALMRLDQPITGVTPAQLYTSFDEVGRIGVAAGYGVTGTGLTGATTLDGKKRGGTNTIDGLFRTGGKTQRLLAMDFDHPNDSGASAFGTTTPESDELLTVFGDSGGPVFIGSQVAGVNSFIVDANNDGVYATYGDYTGHTRVSALAGWIDGVIEGGGGDSGGGPGGPPPGRGRGRFSLADAVSLRAVATVPEPGTLLLLTIGIGALLCFRRRA